MTPPELSRGVQERLARRNAWKALAALHPSQFQELLARERRALNLDRPRDTPKGGAA